MFDIKTIQKACFILTEELISEDEIKARFFDSEPKEIDFEEIDPEQELPIALAFTASIIAKGN